MDHYEGSMDRLPPHLEDAFIKVSFEELREPTGASGETDPSYTKWMDNGALKRLLCFIIVTNTCMQPLRNV